MLTCKEITELCSAELERALRLGETLSLRTHLMMCSGCSHYRQQIRTLREVMQAYAEGKAVAAPDKPATPD